MGSITGWGGGAGTLLGMLLRGYTSGLDEEQKRKALAKQAGMLGLTLPPTEERSYLNRVLAPNAYEADIATQANMLAAFQKQVFETEKEKTKQGFMTERQMAVAGMQASAQMGIAQYKASAGMDLSRFEQGQQMDRLRYQRATPQALDPSVVARNRAAAGASQSSSRYMDMSFKAMLEAMAGKGWGGPAIQGTVGTPGMPTTNAPAPTDVPTGPGGGYEYVPSFGKSGMTLAPQETIARKAETAAAETTARKQAEAAQRNIATDSLVTTLRGLSQKINTQSGPMAAAWQGLKAEAGNLTRGVVPGLPYSKDVSKFQDAADAYLGNIARSRAAEVGTLTDLDIARARKSLSTIYNTREEAQFKYDMLDELGRISETDLDPVEQKRRIQAIIDGLESGSGAGYTILPTGESIDAFLERKP